MCETNFMALLKFTNAIGTSPLQWISKIQGVKKVIFHYLLTEKVIFKFHIYLQFEFNLNHSVLRKCHIKSGLTFWKHKHKKFFQLCKIAKFITIGHRFSWPAKKLAHWVLNFFINGFLIFIKFVFSKMATKSSPSIWHLLHNVKSTVKILSIFVAFLENLNFTPAFWRDFCKTFSLRMCSNWKN